MVRRKIDSLSDQDRKLLSAASVEGFEFDSAVIARTLSADTAEVEESLDKLHRVHGFVQPIGEKEWPGGPVAAAYRFVHFLYYDAFYSAIQPARKASWSAAVAQALLHFHPVRPHEIAAKVALLFEAARDFGHAAYYFSLAAENATKIFAHNEAVLLARRGLRMLEGMPDTLARTQTELDLQLNLGIPLLQRKVTEISRFKAFTIAPGSYVSNSERIRAWFRRCGAFIPTMRPVWSSPLLPTSPINSCAFPTIPTISTSPR